MKKGLLFLIAVFVFTGICNCIAIEPAHASTHEHHENHQQETENSCEVICHFSHHLSNTELQQPSFEQSLADQEVLSFIVQTSPTPPLKGIFHPPASL